MTESSIPSELDDSTTTQSENPSEKLKPKVNDQLFFLSMFCAAFKLYNNLKKCFLSLQTPQKARKRRKKISTPKKKSKVSVFTYLFLTVGF